MIFFFSALLKHESEGLALAVYVKNELVVDLWGGYAEKLGIDPNFESVVFFSEQLGDHGTKRQCRSLIRRQKPSVL